MDARPYLCALLLAGCGLADDAQVECRCTADSDLTLFPACRDAALSDQRPEAGNPFAARLPDCPSGKRLSLLEPTRAEFVLFNIKTTFEGFSPVQYLDQLDEGFWFIPEPEGVELYPEVYHPPEGYIPEQDTLWTRTQERSFAAGLLDKERFQRVEVRRWYESSKDQRTISEDGRSEVFFFPYELDFIPVSGGPDQETFGVKGRMEVEAHTPTAENPVWSLRRWQDFRDPATAKRTWTEARALFSR
jgi:hypothetical protein